MKKLNFLEKIIFFVNSLAVVLLLATYLIPYIDPEICINCAFLSVLYPTILILNIVFVFLWILKLKPHFLLSLAMIAIGYKQLSYFFATHHNNSVLNKDSIKLISYNIRQLNSLKWIKSNHVKQDICNFINKENPDLVCFQEYRTAQKLNLRLKHYIHHKATSSGLAIYSKYPILNSGFIDFKNSSNNSLFIDVKINKTITRVYNIHLQSFSVNTSYDYTEKTKLNYLYDRMKIGFKKQSVQVKTLKKHIKQSPYPVILMGDFNSTAFSWNYNQFKKDFKDAYVEKGFGLGKSYDFLFPFRIDYFFIDPKIEVVNYKTFNIKLSDHYPIMTKIIINN